MRAWEIAEEHAGLDARGVGGEADLPVERGEQRIRSAVGLEYRRRVAAASSFPLSDLERCRWRRC